MLELVKKEAVYPHRVALGKSPGPDARERFVELFLRPARHDFVNEGHILAFRKDEGELFLGCGKDVIDGIFGSVDYLDVLIAL